MVKYPDLHLHIDGEWLEAGSRRVQAVINPATGATLSELPLVDAADLDRRRTRRRRSLPRHQSHSSSVKGTMVVAASVIDARKAMNTKVIGPAAGYKRIATEEAFLPDELHRLYLRLIERGEAQDPAAQCRG
jgi:hypothetical protein